VSSEVSIPEEAIEKAMDALCGGGEEQFTLHVTHRDVATAAVGAAAPLIVAAELERLAEGLAISLGVMDDNDQADPESMPTYDEGIDDVQRLLMGRASVLRGEGQQ
jgi:hypothetical protein